MFDLLLYLVILGLIFWLCEKFIPMAEPFRVAFRIVAVVIVILLLVRAFLSVGPSLRF